MRVLRIRCHCGRNLADCEQQDRRYTGHAGDWDGRVFRSVAPPAESSPIPPPDQHANLAVLARPGVGQRHHQPSGQVLTYSWTCPDCGRTPTVRGHRIGTLYGQHRSDPRRVVHVTFGTDL